MSLRTPILRAKAILRQPQIRKSDNARFALVFPIWNWLPRLSLDFFAAAVEK